MNDAASAVSPSAGESVSSQASSIPAPRLRRFVAWITDLVVAIAISQLVFGGIGFFSPPESAARMMLPMASGLLVGFAYIGLSSPLFGNSLGKWLFGLEITSDDAQPITLARWLLRMLLLVCIWPVNGFFVLSSATRRHLGDLAARTTVAFPRPTRRAWVGLVGAVATVVIAFQLAKAGMMVSVLNSAALKAARAHLAAASKGAEVPRLPHGLQIVNDKALIDIKVESTYRRVLLQRTGEEWTVIGAEEVGSPSTSFGVSFGAADASEHP